MGKSTLFNRLTPTRAAIVNDTSGTTRDRQYGLMGYRLKRARLGESTEAAFEMLDLLAA